MADNFRKARAKYGYINHHPHYVGEKMDLIITRAQNIKNMQSDICGGYKDETKRDLEVIREYVNFFLKDYVDGEVDED